METKTAIDLQRFCSSEDSYMSPKTGRPWTRGDWTYATNGHVIVRLPEIAEITDNKEAPNATGLQWGSVVTDDQWMKIDHIKLELVDCEECEGGEKTPHDCPDCSCECESCDNGKVFDKSDVQVGSKKVQAKYLTLLQSLPGILVAPDATPAWECIPFKFDGGEGLLMPLRD